MRRNIGAYSYDEANAIDPFAASYSPTALRDPQENTKDAHPTTVDRIKQNRSFSPVPPADSEQERSTWPLWARFATIIGLSLLLWGAIIGTAVILLT